MNASTSYGETVVQEYALTDLEREQAREYIRQSRNSVVGAIKGLSEAQWTFTSAPDCWSIAQIVEHVVFVIDRVSGPVREAMAQAPPPPRDHDCQHIDAIVIHQFPSRLTKFPAPAFAYPGNGFASSAIGLEQVTKSYLALSAFLDSTPDLREHALESRPLKAVTNGKYDLFDGYQWILAAAAHAERHSKQILEIKADEAFPEN